MDDKTFLNRLLVFILIASGMFAPQTSIPVLALSNPTITLSPAPATIQGCETILVQAVVNNVTNLYGAEVHLSFNPSVVEVVDSNTGKPGVQIEPGNLLIDPFVASNTADNQAGTIIYMASQVNPTLPITGTGVLFGFRLRAKRVGFSPLEFTTQILANRDGFGIGSTAENGVVNAQAGSGGTPPSLNSIQPAEAQAGSPGFSLAATGANFSESSVIQWNGLALDTTFINVNLLNAAVTSNELAQSGLVNVTVSEICAGTSEARVFTINNPVPTLSGLEPQSMLIGSPDFTLAIRGSKFVPNSEVRWNQTSLITTFVDSAHLTASIPSTLLTQLTTASITVFNPAPAGGVSSAGTFSVVGTEPVANPDWYSVHQDLPLSIQALGVLSNDTDPLNKPLTVSLDTGPSHQASFSLNADGSFVYTPAPGFVGQDSFTYFASNGDKQSVAAKVTINVVPGVPVTGDQRQFIPLIPTFNNQ